MAINPRKLCLQVLALRYFLDRFDWKVKISLKFLHPFFYLNIKRKCNTDAYLDITLKDSLGQYSYCRIAEIKKKKKNP